MENHGQFWEKDFKKRLDNKSHPNKYPFEFITTFVFRHSPKDKPREEVQILEVGCAGGNNLWFAAREGFSVTGIDVSETAIDFAKERFAKNNLKGEFHVGDLIKLPCEDSFFDMVIDRGAITCCGLKQATKAIDEIHRVLLPKGKFIFNGYSEKHSGFISGDLSPLGTTVNMKVGSLVGVEGVYFYSRREVDSVFPADKWDMISCQHVQRSEQVTSEFVNHAEWRVIVEKK